MKASFTSTGALGAAGGPARLDGPVFHDERNVLEQAYGHACGVVRIDERLTAIEKMLKDIE